MKYQALKPHFFWVVGGCRLFSFGGVVVADGRVSGCVGGSGVVADGWVGVGGVVAGGEDWGRVGGWLGSVFGGC